MTRAKTNVCRFVPSEPDNLRFADQILIEVDGFLAGTVFVSESMLGRAVNNGTEILPQVRLCHDGEGKLMRNRLCKTMEFIRSEDGPTVAEYAILLSLLVMAILASAKTLGTAAAALFLSYDWV